ncbi:hypothetical protein ES703_110836 [subsurface metagenome]
MRAVGGENLCGGVVVDVPDGSLLELEGAFDFPSVPEAVAQRPESAQAVLIIVPAIAAAKIDTLAETYGQVSHVGFTKVNGKSSELGTGFSPQTKILSGAAESGKIKKVEVSLDKTETTNHAGIGVYTHTHHEPSGGHFGDVDLNVAAKIGSGNVGDLHLAKQHGFPQSPPAALHLGGIVEVVWSHE